ncbi:MAG TPA: septum site-determining protein MinC [Limnobacter sp.]|uniref:septum site-determining protein MinC n=1 Tax=Limnobacter sp. TaxID=2003368 RepID=UPI002E32BD27|nr:septum site-determining protein MinC [Limnobacter sp.]HEX5484415.1 septum site-determining protein MinC [Limnobacter sp.]
MNTSNQALIEIRFAKLNALAVHCEPGPLAAIVESLGKRLGKKPSMYTVEPAVLDLSAWTAQDLEEFGFDLKTVKSVFDAAGVHLVEVRCSLPEIEAIAEDMGLKCESGEALTAEPEARTAAPEAETPSPATPVDEPVAEVQTSAQATARKTLVIDNPVRSGQKIYAQGADLIVMGQVSHGAEVIADGNVHVYGVLRGRALAGAAGDRQARIISTCFEAELVAVAGYYLTFEAGFPEESRSKPTLIVLDEAQEPAQLRLKPINIR